MLQHKINSESNVNIVLILNKRFSQTIPHHMLSPTVNISYGSIWFFSYHFLSTNCFVFAMIFLLEFAFNISQKVWKFILFKSNNRVENEYKFLLHRTLSMHVKYRDLRQYTDKSSGVKYWAIHLYFTITNNTNQSLIFMMELMFLKL